MTNTNHGERIETLQGTGTVVYTKADGWIGVRLDGEKRVDEYPAEHCKPAK